MTTVTPNGNAYSDDGTAARDLRNGGHRTWLLPMIGDVLTDLRGYLGSVLYATTKAAADAAVAAAQRAQDAVAGVTVGSTSALAFPGVDKTLLSATDVGVVYVYDTRLDDRLPDGGRWNEPGRCSHTSWWNEPLNTVTRGAKRDFPVVALIVAQQYRVTIYDALDVDPATGVPRMWMVFNIIFPFKGWAPVTGLCARNGRLYRTANTGTAGDLYITDFAADLHYYYGSGGKAMPNNPRVADRNAAGSSQTVAGPGIASDQCTAVHARVLPGAPLDAAGLPIPTVAVATGGGVSVIHGSGQVATVTGVVNCTSLCITARPAVMVEDVGGDLLEVALPYASGAATVLQRFGPGRTTYGGLPLSLSVNSAYKVVDAAAGGRNGGGVTFLDKNYARDADGMVAYATTTYATGWLAGDCRLATLCDGATGSITGSGELVSNSGGPFTTAAGYGTNGAAVSVSAGELVVAAATSGGYGTISIATVPGSTYMVVVPAKIGTTTAARVRAVGLTVRNEGYTTASSVAPVVFHFAADSATTEIRLACDTVGTAAFGGVSCKLACADRSYKGRGLIVNGTLQRTPVATGADVVMWSGWGSDAYSEQPYNADLDVGTGDFWIAAWTTATTGSLFERGTSGLPTGLVRIAASGGVYQFTVVDSATASGGVASATPTLLIAQRVGGVLELCVNGQKVNTASGPAISTTMAGAVTRVGCAIGGAAPANGGIAMVRYGAGALTPALIRKIYEDERHLFQDGAKCLLGGASSNVTSLDHDPLTGRLAVGTGDGVSLFRGLRRVGYVDEAVLAATTSDTVRSVALRGGNLLVGTAAEAGFVADALPGKEAILVGGPRPVGDGFTARGVTTDGAALDLAPRVPVGERETVLVEARIVGRVHGAADTERLTYVRRATVYRDAGGAIALQGAVQPLGADTEVTGTADATLAITGDWVAARVTGVVGKRIAWSASFTVTRVSEETSYAA